MKNSRSATGVGAGELSEYLLSHALLERHCGIRGTVLHTRILDADAGERQVTLDWSDSGTSRQITYRFDGKTLEAAREYEAHLTTPNDLVRELSDTAATVARNLQLDLPGPIRELHALGGSGGKSDLTIHAAPSAPGDVKAGGPGAPTAHLSLKYGHHAAARHQSPTWKGVERAYRSIGADITQQREAYLAAHRQFMTPQLRHSRTKGDYSPPLRANCDTLVAAHHQINLYLAEHPDRIDRAALACELLRGYTGAAAHIHLIDMRSGSVSQLHSSTSSHLATLLARAEIVARAHRSDSGRTLTLQILADSVEVARLYTTASTNAARGQRNRDLRTPKPQTYLIPNLNLLSAAGTAAVTP